MSIFSSTMLDNSRHMCVLIRFEETSDGRGGQNTEWTEVAEFEGLFDYKSSTQVLIAEKQGFTSVYTIYVPKTLAVQHHDVIRRVSDGLTLRVTHDGTDDMTPDTSAINWKRCVCEIFDFPNTVRPLAEPRTAESEIQTPRLQIKAERVPQSGTEPEPSEGLAGRNPSPAAGEGTGRRRSG